ncbi:DHH family phosphoesterase, partial [bacterium]|nr:DHH family phosphoesterase [bacterium]
SAQSFNPDTWNPGGEVSNHDWDPDRQCDKLLELIPDSGNILLSSHDNPDPDALASCMALQQLISAKKGITPRIAIAGILGRAENRAMSLELEIDLVPIEILEDKHWDAVIMVDAQPRAGNTHLNPNLPITAVIDHHPARDDLEAKFIDIRPEYGAVSTIIIEYFLGQNLTWSTKLATALFYAIKSETADLGRGICDADRRAYFALFDSVDWEIMHRIIKAKIPGDYFQLYPRGIEAALLYGNAVVCDLGEIPVPDAVAEIADFMLRHEAVSRSLVIGQYEDQLVFSIRFSSGDLDAGVIASGIVKGFGTGGGHDLMAGGRIILKKSQASRSGQICTTLVDRFIDQVGQTEFKPGIPLIKDSSSETKEES